MLMVCPKHPNARVVMTPQEGPGTFRCLQCEADAMTQEVAGPSPKEWTQREITEWAINTFGMTPTPIVAMRMNKEVAELLTALALGDWKEARKEAADVGVMLLQVAELLGIDLMAAVSEKMEINAKRQWERTPAGDFQHVEGT